MKKQLVKIKWGIYKGQTGHIISSPIRGLYLVSFPNKQEPHFEIQACYREGEFEPINKKLPFLKRMVDKLVRLWHTISNKKERVKVMNIEKAIKKILEGGTKIVSFTYDGEARNVLIGANEILSNRSWGNQEDRAIRRHEGKTYLVARVQNEEKGAIRAFNLAKIENFSAL